MKINKKELLLTSLVCLLPLLAGVALYPRLPETMATHWGFDGTANRLVVACRHGVRPAAVYFGAAPHLLLRREPRDEQEYESCAADGDAVDLSRDVAAWQCAHAWHGAGL